MARRPNPPEAPKRPLLSSSERRRCVERLKRRIDDLRNFDPQTVQKRFAVPEVMALEASIDEALSAAFGHGTVEYDRYQRAKQLDHGPVAISFGSRFTGYDDSQAYEARKYLTEGKEEALALLGQAVRTLEEELADEEAVEPEEARPGASEHLAIDKSKIFVVHGHDEGARESVARFIGEIGFRPIILHEQANQGRTVIEKVEAHSEVGFAVVLLTPDDLGKAKDAPDLAPRARQNVILELGYFLGRLGRSNVCALLRGDIEIPSDFGGVVYERLDEQGGWKAALGRELEIAGYAIDWNLVMRR